MKIKLTKQCNVELDSGNYCRKCKKNIQDFSKLSQPQLHHYLNNDHINCGIFNSNQLKYSKTLKSLVNVLVVSVASLTYVNAQNLEVSNNNNRVEDSLQNIQFTFQLKSNPDQNLEKEGSFRLLINDQLIMDTIELNKEYVIRFDIAKASEINIRIASNDFPNKETSRILHQHNFPDNLSINIAELRLGTLIMGKINYGR